MKFDVPSKVRNDHPIGETFYEDGVEFAVVVTDDSEIDNDCVHCHFEHKDCSHLICTNTSRKDRTNVFFLPLSEYVIKRMKGTV